MNPVRHIPMVPKPRKLPFIPRSSLQSIPAIRSLAWRRGAGAADDPSLFITDPNTEAGFGTKSAADTTTSVSSSGGALPAANTAVNNSTQVVVSTPGGVNLRSQASTSSPIVKGENAGTILQVLGRTNDGWLNVQDPQGAVGWVYSAYVSDASAGQGTVAAPDAGASPLTVGGASDSVSGMPLGASGIVGLLVVGGLVTGAYYLLVK